MTESDWLLKDDTHDNSATCFMVIRRQDGVLLVQWFFRQGVSTAVSTEMIHTEDCHRMVCCYEAERLDDDGASTLSHRGCCLLDVTDDGLTGPYFTDRRTHGTMTFTEHRPTMSASYREAKWLFDST